MSGLGGVSVVLDVSVVLVECVVVVESVVAGRLVAACCCSCSLVCAGWCGFWVGSFVEIWVRVCVEVVRVGWVEWWAVVVLEGGVGLLLVLLVLFWLNRCWGSSPM